MPNTMPWTDARAAWSECAATVEFTPIYASVLNYDLFQDVRSECPTDPGHTPSEEAERLRLEAVKANKGTRIPRRR